MTAWQERSRQKKAESAVKSAQQMDSRPGWNDNVADNPHKLSHAEVLQRKLNAKSKNEASAREDLQKKMDKLKAGKIPREYKEITDKGPQKYTSKQAFIQDKNLKEDYQNRSYAS